MKFFVPGAKDDKMAEGMYVAISKHVNAPVKGERIWKVEWKHGGMDMECEVGGKMPDYCRLGDDPVFAIFDVDSMGLYYICTANRGGFRGEPILAKKDEFSHATYFD